jgi:DNA polymerase-4
VSAALLQGAARRRAVGFAEVPDFHVEVARRADVALADRSLIVGGDPAKRGRVVAVTPDLRARGVVEGMASREALEKVPSARWVRTDMARAREASGQVRAAVRSEVEAVEVVGLAGFYLAAPAARDAALELARRLERSVRSATGLPLRVGVAPARFAARLAAEDAGRSGARVVTADEFDAYLRRQPIERLPGVGPKTAARLVELGVFDVPSLRALGNERLEVLFGHHGRTLWLLASGEDPKPLRARRQPATLSREETFADPCFDRHRLGSSLARLARSLEGALRRDGLRAGRIALRLTYADARTVTRSRSLEVPVVEAGPLAAAADDLLERIEPSERPVRRAALVLAGLELAGAEDRQLDLF